jgi:murein L,D-transpeptidase YcbB/YkuD
MEDFYSEESRSVLLQFRVRAEDTGEIDLAEMTLSYDDLVAGQKQEIKKQLSVSVSRDVEMIMARRNKKVAAEAALIRADREHEKYVRMYEKGYQDEAVEKLGQLAERLESENEILGDLRIRKKADALKLEQKEMERAEEDASYRADYLKQSKQALYYSKKGKRQKYLLQEGSRGLEVERLQRALKDEGFYKGKIDGLFDGEVKASVEEFQRDKGLAVDGVAGPNTMKRLGLLY